MKTFKWLESIHTEYEYVVDGMESKSLPAIRGLYLITRKFFFDYAFIIFPIFISIFVREYNFWTTGESNGGELMATKKISLFNLFQFKCVLSLAVFVYGLSFWFYRNNLKRCCFFLQLILFTRSLGRNECMRSQIDYGSQVNVRECVVDRPIFIKIKSNKHLITGCATKISIVWKLHHFNGACTLSIVSHRIFPIFTLFNQSTSVRSLWFKDIDITVC